jgi:hypothetical protein
MKSKLCRFWVTAFLSGCVFFLPLFPARADVLDRWSTNQIGANLFASQTQHVIYANGLFVAYLEAGDGGNFYSSVDGRHWVLQTNNPNAWGLTLTYSGGKFVGISGFGLLASSSDGTNWLFSFVNACEAMGDYNNHDITYANGVYVLVGDTGGYGTPVATIFTSPDGVAWTARALPNPGGSISSVVSYSGGLGASYFVAIGKNDGHLYYSTWPNGAIWSQGTIPGGSSISHAGGLLIVPYGPGTNLLSTDGVNWTPQPTGLTNLMGKVTCAHGLFMTTAGGHVHRRHQLGAISAEYAGDFRGGFGRPPACHRWFYW